LSKTNKYAFFLSVLLIIFLAFAFVGWGKYGQLKQDSSRSIYVPLRVLQGRTIYRDVYWEYGPFTPYFNALLYKLFGANFNTVFGSGLIISLIITCLAWEIARFLFSPIESFFIVCCLLVTGIFFFTDMGYILPYSLAAVHGSLWGLLFVFSLISYIRAPHDIWIALAGLATGLALITKLEYAVAILITGLILWAGVKFLLQENFISKNLRSRTIYLYLLPAILIPVVTYCSLLRKMDIGVLLNGLFPIDQIKYGFINIPDLNQVIWVFVVYIVLAGLIFLFGLKKPRSARIPISWQMLAIVIAFFLFNEIFSDEKRFYGEYIFYYLNFYYVAVTLGLAYLVYMGLRYRKKRRCPSRRFRVLAILIIYSSVLIFSRAFSFYTTSIVYSMPVSIPILFAALCPFSNVRLGFCM